MRLNRFLSQTGLGSRRKCDEFIRKGFVKINGEVVKEPWVKVSPEKEVVSFLGEKVLWKSSFTYILLNKPSGYIVSSHDPRGRKTVIDLLSGVRNRVFPVGRLDYMSEGALILTDDGDLALRLTHPRYGVERCYYVDVKGEVTKEKLARMRTPLKFPDGMVSRVVSARVLSERGEARRLEVVLKEGWKREVRRICEFLGLGVVSLKRVSFGTIRLGALKKGSYRFLSDREVRSLKIAVGLRGSNSVKRRD